MSDATSIVLVERFQRARSSSDSASSLMPWLHRRLPGRARVISVGHAELPKGILSGTKSSGFDSADRNARLDMHPPRRSQYRSLDRQWLATRHGWPTPDSRVGLTAKAAKPPDRIHIAAAFRLGARFAKLFSANGISRNSLSRMVPVV